MLFFSVYGNSSISSTSLYKLVDFSYLHVTVIDIMDTTTVIVNIKRGLIKTHVEFMKKGYFLWLEFLFVKV
jgi:hypothetical protein